MNKYADLHSHCSLLSFNSGVDGEYNKDLDLTDQPNIGDMVIEEKKRPAKYSQADFGSLRTGGAKLVFASLYPIERNFFEPIRWLKIIKWLGLERFVANIDPKRINEIEADKTHKNYFADLTSEYRFLRDNQSNTSHPYCKTPYQIISSYEHLLKLQTEHPGTIAVVLTIEGASAFGISDQSDPEDIGLQTQVMNNIKDVKAWSSPDGKLSYSPLFVTFCHHFYNNLAGHSLSSPNINIDQKKGINTGFTKFGKQVLGKLLSKNEGRRILIDIKHMSIASRREYYQFLEENYPDNEIPIIASHCAVNGHAGYSEACNDITITAGSKPRDIKKGPISVYDNSEVYNPWSINLFDIDIIKIHKSKGLMGIIMDQRILAGGIKVKKVKEKYTWAEPEPYDDNNWFDNKQFQADWTELFYKQISRIYNVLLNSGVPANECFNSICIGSDFDGMIDAIDAVNTTLRFPVLEKNLVLHFTKNKDSYVQSGLSASEIVDKIMYTNAETFLERFYNDKYLS